MPALADVVDLERHPLDDPAYRAECRRTIDTDGALVLTRLLRPTAISDLVAEAERLRPLAYFSTHTHSVYLDPADPRWPASDARSREVASTKGAVTTDQIPARSGLRVLYTSACFRSFLCDVLGEDQLHEYADPLSSINVNFFEPGQELGWHFDNSSFAVTLLLQEPAAGGVFEFFAAMRDSATGRDDHEAVALALDDRAQRSPSRLAQHAGDLALFRGRDALHRVTPVAGDRTRLLVVLAYNTEPGIELSENARMTFFGRLG